MIFFLNSVMYVTLSTVAEWQERVSRGHRFERPG